MKFLLIIVVVLATVYSLHIRSHLDNAQNNNVNQVVEPMVGGFAAYSVTNLDEEHQTIDTFIR